MEGDVVVLIILKAKCLLPGCAAIVGHARSQHIAASHDRPRIKRADLNRRDSTKIADIIERIPADWRMRKRKGRGASDKRDDHDSDSAKARVRTGLRHA